jgi:hypothetical protein
MRLRKPHYGEDRNWPRAGDRTEGYGPQFGFAAATFAGFAAWTGSVATLPPGFAAPIVTTVFLVMAGVFGLVAWRCRNDDPFNVTYTDVAGALTLIGLCASATIDPDPLLRLVQGDGGSES